MMARATQNGRLASTLERLVRELSSMTDTMPKDMLVRVETHMPDAAPLAWLESQRVHERVYWSDREHAFSVAGIGIAAVEKAEKPGDTAEILARLKSRLSARFSAIRYYGGMRFDNLGQVDDRWKMFGAYRFIVPEVEFGCLGNRCYMAWNGLVPEGACGADFVERLKESFEQVRWVSTHTSAPLPRTTSREDRPDRRTWDAMVRETLGAISNGEIEKAVLARESHYAFDDFLDPVALLRALEESTTYSFHFCFQPAEAIAFIGASPERLYKRVNTYLQSEALAGTRPRGGSPDEDRSLGKSLLTNEKECREHKLVLDSIRKVFANFCRAVRGDDHVELLVLRHCQHLLSRIEGMLNESESDGELLPALHPTPAVGGLPREPALKLIRELEPFDRGWYAAPVGWVGFDSTEFAVAIRSGLVVDETLSLYTGAGIVPGSTPQGEWAEIENKMTSFVEILDTAAVSTSTSDMAS